MLAADQLAVAEHPRITAIVERAEGSLPNLKLHMRLKVRDKEQTLVVPATISVDSGTLLVSGQVELSQKAFGIEPYTALLGAISVDDKVRVKFEILAKAR